MSRRRRRGRRRTFGALVLAGAGLEVGRRLGRVIWRGMVLGAFVGVFVLACGVYALAVAVPPAERVSVTLAVGGVLVTGTIGAYCLLKSQWWARHRTLVGTVVIALVGIGALVFAVLQAEGI